MATATAGLLSLVREAVDHAESPDPDVIAAGLLPGLPRDELERLAYHGLREMVRAGIRAERRAAPPLSIRWGAAAAHQVSGALDVLRKKVWVGGGWAFLGDCTPDDVAFVAARYRERETREAGRAERYEALVRLMLERGAEKVSDLGADAVAEVIQ